MSSDVDSPMKVVAHRQLSSTSVCRYYRFSGTCRYQRCGSSHVLEALPSDGAHKQEGLPSVHERPWVLTSEEESSCEEGSAEAWRFSVASYNILADKYAKQYRSYLYHDVPSGYLDWSHRKSAIIAELAHLQPDIICLQEVDRYEDLEAQLQELGYSGIYLQRDGGRRDGCATFWRSSLLRPALVRQLRYSQYDLKDNVALLVLFEPHKTASTAQQVDSQQQQQQVQPPLVSQQLAQQQVQEQQQEQRHKQDLLSQWLPRNWLHSSHQQHLKHHGQHKQLGRSASLNLHPSSPGDLYQQPDGTLQHGYSLDSSKGTRSSKHGNRSRHRKHDGKQCSPNFADGSVDDLQQCPEQVPLQLAPDWLNCGILVANTHIIFTPDKGEVKLGQARMLVQEAAQMAQWYLNQQQQEQEGPTASKQTHVQRSTGGGGAGLDSKRNTQDGCNSSSSKQAEEPASAPHGVVTIVAGDFNAIPQSPMYSFMADGCVDLHQVNKRNVSHMACGGSSLHKGYKGFRRASKRKSMEEQRRSMEQQRTNLDCQQQPQQLVNGEVALVATAAGAASAGPSTAASPAGLPYSTQQQSAAGSSALRSNSAGPAAAAGTVASSPARSSSMGSYPILGSPYSSSKLHRWSDKDCRRAAGMSFDELVEASSTAGPVATADRPASPSTKIARAAAAFGQRVAAGAGAAAASVAASVAAELGGVVAGGGSRCSAGDAGAVKPLLLRHSLQLRSSYFDVLGREPEYTSSHSQFMDTCDYIWYTDTALCSTQPTQQQHKQHAEAESQSADCRVATATATAQQISEYDQSEQQLNSTEGLSAERFGAYQLRPVAVLVPPDGMKLPKGLPSRWLGSDHVCLVADFSLCMKHT